MRVQSIPGVYHYHMHSGAGRPAGRDQRTHQGRVPIVQSKDRSRIGTVIAAAVTGNVRLQAMPGNVLLSKGSAGMPRDSVVNVSQLVTIERRRPLERGESFSIPGP
jgi:mRNA-degrading endonuclease toxin of MazEF toxin-antitoxin module